HDALDAALRVEVGARQLRLDRLVAAADVVADAGRRHVALVGDATADRLAVARVMVGAENAEVGVAGRHAALELLEAARVHVAEGLDRAHRIAPFALSWEEDTGRNRTAVSRVAAACLAARPRCQGLREDSNLCARGRSPVLYPLSYGGECARCAPEVRAEGVEPP